MVRVELAEPPVLRLTAFQPPLKMPSFALYNEGRHWSPAAAFGEAIARLNRLRIASIRSNEDGSFSLTLTDKRTALRGSNLFHVPKATVIFRIKPRAEG